jgi:hypothetical protein
MQLRRPAARPLFIATLTAGLFVARAATIHPVAQARSNPTGGTITVNATDMVRNGGDTKTVTCNYTLTVNSATQVTITFSQATYDETNIINNADGTTRTITIQAKLNPNQATYQEGPQYLPVITTSNEDARVPAGDYGLSFTLPPNQLLLQGTQTIAETNQPGQTTADDVPLFCPNTAPKNGDELLGRLTGSGTASGQQPIQYDWAGIGGVPGGQISWSLTDPALKTNPLKKLLPTGGDIKVTNNGIEASLKWKDFTISYSGDWKATQQKSGTPPTITSPSKNVQLSVNQVPATTAPATTAQQAIHAGKTGAGATVTGSKPFAIGPLTGVADTYTSKGGTGTQMMIVVGNGQQQIVIQLTIKPNASPEEILAAGEAIGSVTLGQ